MPVSSNDYYRGKIRSVLYSPHTRKLLSSGEDAQVGVWDVDIQREETAEWGAGNTCEKCGIPFFWNVKEMWAKKTIGVRQVCCVEVSTLLYVHV